MGFSSITNDINQHIVGRVGRVFNLEAIDAYFEAQIVPTFDRKVEGHGMSKSAIGLLCYKIGLAEGETATSTIVQYDSEDGTTFTEIGTIYTETFTGGVGGSEETVFRQIDLDWSTYRRYIRHINTLELSTLEENPTDYIRGALVYAIAGFAVTGDI